MNEYIWFLLTVAVGTLGAMLAIRCKIPTAGIIGSMIAVILLNVISDGRAEFFPFVKLVVQLTVGTACGSRIGKSELKRLRAVIVPVLIIFPLLIVYNLVFGALMIQTGELDPYTCLYSLAPGSVSDIAIIAEELGADPAIVGLIHAIRVLVCSSLIPAIMGLITKFSASKEPAQTASPVVQQEGVPMAPHSNAKLLCMFALSISGGLLLRSFGIAGGAIIGSMVPAAVFTCLFGKCTMPKWLKRVQQISTGSYVGASVTRATIMSAGSIIVPILILLADIVISTLLTSWLVMKTKKMDLVSSMASCNPGGLTEMLLVTDEMGGDVPTVAAIHSFRLFFVIAVFPTIINRFALLFL